MYSTKLTVSIHILCVVGLNKQPAVTSDTIASSIQTNPALVRRLMGGLKAAGLVKAQTKLGVTGLGRPANQISMLDIFKAVEKEQHLFNIHANTNERCPVGANIERVMGRIRDTIQADFEKELDSVPLSDILDSIQESGDMC